MMKTKTWLVVGMALLMATGNVFGRGSGHSRASMGRSSGRSTFGKIGYMRANMAALKARHHLK